MSKQYFQRAKRTEKHGSELKSTKWSIERGR